MDINEYIKKSVRQYNGELFYIVYYNGECYLGLFINGVIKLCTNEPLNGESYISAGSYLTPILLEELDELYKARMYITYKGREFIPFNISPKMEILHLRTLDGHTAESDSLGFKYVRELGMTIKQIGQDEIEDIRIEKESVLEKYRNNYGQC